MEKNKTLKTFSTFQLLKPSKFSVFQIKKYLIIIGGPTASGKTALSIELARHFDAPILSADSRQFYKEMRIGNARPSEEELSQIKHYFVADRSVEETLSAGAFAKEALLFLEKHFQKHNYAILTGGSGLFLKAVTEGLNSFPQIDSTIRVQVDQLFEEKGLEGLQSALSKADADYFAEVDQNNASRLRRALEVCYAGEHPFSYYRNKKTDSISFFTPIYLQTSWPREELYDRINNRVGVMLKEGLEQEAHDLYRFKNLASLKTVGYQEWFAHFDGEYDRERAIELIKQNTRRYAKRQLTWFRRDAHWKHVFKGDVRSALSYIQLVETKGLELLKPAKEDATEKVSSKYKVIQAHLGIKQTNKVLARSTIWKYKDEAWLKEWSYSDLDYLAKMILMHETLHLSECEKVFAFSNNKDLQDSGFQKSTLSDLPIWLKPEVNKNSSLWVWERSKQPF